MYNHFKGNHIVIVCWLLFPLYSISSYAHLSFFSSCLSIWQHLLTATKTNEDNQITFRSHFFNLFYPSVGSYLPKTFFQTQLDMFIFIWLLPFEFYFAKFQINEFVFWFSKFRKQMSTLPNQNLIRICSALSL